MAISRDAVNRYFGALVALPDGNVLSKEGFLVLADWSEQQEWWWDFALLHALAEDWRTTSMGDPNNFALTLFRFLSIPQALHKTEAGIMICSRVR